ncbi:MAG: 2-hydroxyacyl-CoA dehydratase [Deltaproteobacteria bacterium]|nr:2-hydroxyacyl-CoA dehydratase [Deltaproteobacteria bacterium]
MEAQQSSLTRYDHFRKVDAVCDLFQMAIATGASSPADLDIPMLMGILPEYHASLVPQIYPEVIEAILKPKNRAATLAHMAAAKRYVADLTAALDRGQPVLYNFAVTTPEIFLAMDLVPLCYELMPLYIAAAFVGGVDQDIDLTEDEGLPGHICSAQKAPNGALMSGKMPMPDIMVKTTVPCNSSNMMYQWAQQQFGAKVVVVDSPYYANRRAFGYYVQEWKNMVRSVEQLTGHKLDEERLRHHVQLGNEQLKYYYGLQELRRRIPNPDPGMHRALDVAGLYLCGANQEMVEYSKTCYREARERADAGIAVVGDKKEIRTIWTWGSTPHMLYLPDWLEDRFGMSFLECGLSYMPAEIVGYVDTTSVDSMIEGLALRAFNMPMGRTGMTHADLMIEDFVKVAKAYHADAAVFSGHMACKHSWAVAKMLGDALQERAGIPSFKWETDLLDTRFTPHSSAKAQLGEFFETLM